MNKAKVLVTRRWPGAVEQRLKERYDVTLNENDVALNAEQLKQALQNYDAVLPTVSDTLDADIINTPDKRAKIIGNFGVGYNNIDIAAAKQQGLIVTNTPGVLTDCTADIAILLLLMSARRASEGERELRAGQWAGWRPTHLLGQKVSGKTLGLVGFGRIGQAVAQRARFGFGMNILVYNRSVPEAKLMQDLNAEFRDNIEDLLKDSDFVTLHCPGGEQTRRLINAQRLAIMRPHAHLINTARGDVIDSRALIKALQENWIAGAGLDVYENEPHLDPEFLSLNNATLLPHLGSASEETRTAMGNRVLANIDAFFSGQEPGDRVV